MGDDRDHSKADRIAAVRAALQAAYKADPEGTIRFQARMAKIEAVRKRERERFDILVLGNIPETPKVGPRPKGMSKDQWRIEKRRRQEEALANISLAAKHRGKQATPETLEKFGRAHAGALAQLFANAVIDKDQLAWAHEIAEVADAIMADVNVTTMDLEWRVDPGRHHHDRVSESIARTRAHVAYTLWREQLPNPKALVLDMLTGDQIGFTVAARRHHVHHRTAKRLLIAAIDRWPVCKDQASRQVRREDLAEIDRRVA